MNSWKRAILCALLLSVLTRLISQPPSINAQSPFQLVGNTNVIGLQTDYNVGPGLTPGSQRFYAAYFNESPGGGFDVLSIDPKSGDTQAIHSPVVGEYGAWGLAVGPDGNMYLGTAPGGHFMRINTSTGTISDLGQPSPTETYIWTAVFGSDGRLYGVTYPNCKLVRYDPASGQLSDLGSLDPTQPYARTLVATADGNLYIGIGAYAANVVSYNIGTGAIQELLPAYAQAQTFPFLHVGVDGNAYALVGSSYFMLTPTSATAVSASQVSPALPHNKLSDGDMVTLDSSLDSNSSYALQMTVWNPRKGTSKTSPVRYSGKPVNIFRLGAGPGGVIYGSTILPADLFKINASQDGLQQIGNVGSGEIYSFLPYGDTLEMAAYYGQSALMSYTPGTPLSDLGSSQNPVLQDYSGSDPGWRPEAMAEGSDGHIYVGGQAGYGQSNGPLVEWDPIAQTAQIDGAVTNQLISSLVPWEGEVIVGTAKLDPGNRDKTTAVLFGWGTTSHNADWSATPVAGAGSISNLVAGGDGLIYGIADDTFFEFNPATQQVTNSVVLGFPPSGGTLYNSAGIDSAGRIWGLSPHGIYVIDTATLYATLLAPSPVPITQGWAMSNGQIYFASGASVYRYTIPTTAGVIEITPELTSWSSNTRLNVTVTVTGQSPTGTITLTAGSYTSQPKKLQGGSCTFTVPANSFAAGAAASITAFYSGDVQNLYSTTSVQVTPSSASANVSVGLSSSYLPVGKDLTVWASVTGNSTTPTGTVTVSAGSYTAQATLKKGSAKFNVPGENLSAGTDTVAVTYSGDSYYGAATGTASVVVAQATPMVRLAASVYAVSIGLPFSATVTVWGSNGTPTGSATLTAGTYTTTEAITNGTASFTIPVGSLSLGTDTISVSYSGSQSYLSGTAETTVFAILATPEISISPATSTASSASAQTFTVTASGTIGVPTGTVTLWGPGYYFGTLTLSNGTATFYAPAYSFPVGQVRLTASYSGDANYRATQTTISLNETQ
jgi:hypothetical protein